MTYEYQRPPDPGDGLRLHLNENTGGCSPAVVEALRAIDAGQAALYPDYSRATRECAAALGVPEASLLLINGLDEGILASAVSAIRRVNDGPADALVVEPAFDMYAACVDVAGGRVVAIAPQPDFTFPLEAVLAALSDTTRAIFLTNPNNPTGLLIPREAIRAIARRAGDALVFLDEAYAEFSGETFLDEIESFPNVVVGRTFAKAYGLAGLRIGALVGQRATLAPIRRVVPPYSLNLCAVVGLRAALRDTAHLRRYLDEVARSKALLYAACDRLGLECWPSAANFVLIRAGEAASRLVQELAARRIFVRDRSGEPGCAGCIRVTAGVVAHTEACIAAMEEILCAAR